MRALRPLLFPFLLSLLPIVALAIGYRQSAAFALERERQRWDQHTANLVNEVRSEIGFEQQITRMGHRLVMSFSPRLPKQTTLSGTLLRTAFERAFAASHRPAGTLLYGFSIAPGGSCRPIHDGSLAGKSSRLLAELFGRMADPGSVPAGDRSTLDKRCAGLFGEDCSFDLLATQFRGRPLLGRFLGQPSWILWNTVSIGPRTIGGFFVVLPQSAAETSRPIEYALKRGFVAGAGLVPVLVPLEGWPHLPCILPPGYRGPDSFRRFLTRARQLPDRFRNLPPGGRVERFQGFWMVRDFLSRSLPYELWLVSRPAPRQAGKREPIVLAAALLFASIWLPMLGLAAFSGQAPTLSTRFRLTSLFVFLATLSLSGLHFFGAYFIETAVFRQTHEKVRAHLERLEEADRGVSAVYQHFTNLCKQRFDDHGLGADLLSTVPGVASSAAESLMTYFGKQDPAMPLEFLLLYNLENRTRSIWPNDAASGGQSRSSLLILAVFLEEVLQRLEPESVKASGFLYPTKNARLVATSIRNSLESGAFSRFRDSRQQTRLFTNDKTSLLQFYDIFARNGKLAGVVFALTQAPPAFSRYLLQTFVGLCLSHPSTDFGVGEIHPGGHTALYPASDRLWRTRHGKRLDSLMGLAARTRSTRLVLEPQRAFLALDCDQSQGFVLGAIVSFDEIHAQARMRRAQLATLIVLLLLLVMTAGLSTADHLLMPLARLERGLLQVADGSLDTRVGLSRNDELGDLTGAYDEMIRGFRERRELGRYVSGALDADVSRMSETTRLAVSRNGAVLVADLRGFTTLSERHPPRDIIRMLNIHHQAMAQIIQGLEGTVEQFIGDAIVGVFFGPTEPAAQAALEAGKRIMARHRSIQSDRRSAGDFVYDIGVGIDVGTLLSVTFGSATRQEFAVLGPPRTRAEILEALSKAGRHSKIILSAAAAGACRGELFEAMFLEDGREWVGPS